MLNTDATFRDARPPDRKSGKAVVIAGTVLLSVSATMAFAQQGAPDGAALPQAPPFSVGRVLTFLLVVLGPSQVIGPFAAMTHGRDPAFKRQLAFRGILIAAVGLIAAATIGVNTLREWEISPGALQLAGGIILFLVALRTVMEEFEPKKPKGEKPESGATPPPSASDLAFSPLAFPTIVTPWAVAVVILLVVLRRDFLLEIAAVTALVLVLDLLAMLYSDRILKNSLVISALAIVNSVLGVLQVALAVQASYEALRMIQIT